MTTPTGYTENEPVIVDAYDGPLRGMYLGVSTVRRAYTHDGEYLRIRVTETAQGYEYGEEINALPQRVTRDEDTARAIAIAEDMATRPRMTLAEAERRYRKTV